MHTASAYVATVTLVVADQAQVAKTAKRMQMSAEKRREEEAAKKGKGTVGKLCVRGFGVRGVSAVVAATTRRASARTVLHWYAIVDGRATAKRLVTCAREARDARSVTLCRWTDLDN